MREIKFRAWDAEKSEMINCYDSEKASKVVALYLNDSTLDLMQYVGLKDKNGKEIYEGDIVKHVRPMSFGDDYVTGEPVATDQTLTRIGECRITSYSGVLFVGKKMSWNDIDDELLQDWTKWRGNLSMVSIYSEIIGNIHENPELL